MNKTSHLVTLGAALVLAPLTSTFAQSNWETVDAFSMGTAGSTFGMTAVDNGVVFAAGSGTDLAGIMHAFVRRSLDGGASWSHVLDMLGNGTAISWAVTVGQHSGLVFATASRQSAKNAAWNEWVTLRSADGGTTWSMVDVLTASNHKASPYAVVEDSAGRVFVGGNFGDSRNADHSLIRRSLDGGTTWTTVDDVAPGGLNQVNSLTVTPAGIFAAGLVRNSWTVRRSTNGGTTWTTMDTFQPISVSYVSRACGIAADASGNLYATGQAQFLVNKVAQTRWITRKSADGGTTWRTVDDLLPGASSGAKAVTVDAFGRVFAAGSYTSVSGSLTTNHWVARVSVDGGVTWATSEDYLNGVVFAAASDAVGNVFVGGKVRGPISNPSAGVRKLAAP